MDVIMAERVNKLARSLKDLHLAVSMDEAFLRAKEILLGAQTSQDSVVEEKTLNELMFANEQKPAEKKDDRGINAPVEEIIIESSPKENAEQQNDSSEQKFQNTDKS